MKQFNVALIFLVSLSSGTIKAQNVYDIADAYFVEYSYGSFRMMFVKSILPANDYRNQIYNNIEVTFTYDRQYGGGGCYIVGGNMYRMIQFKDDENHSYNIILKANSVHK